MPRPHERDLDATRAALERWFAARFPQARELAVSELRAPSETGYSSDTLMFELSRLEAGERRRDALVARLEPRGFRVFPSYDLARQYRVLEALAKTDVPVPALRGFEPDPTVLGSPFYVMARVEGRVPPDTPPYHTQGWVYELAPAEREALWWSGFDAMLRVHRLDWQALGLGFLDEPGGGATRLERHLQYYDEFMSWGLERSRYPLLERALAGLRAARPSEPAPALCWGDSRLANQIFRGVECVAVLDWEMVRVADPVEDLAWWIALDRCFCEGIGAPRLAGLPDRPATVARWEAQTGRRADALGYYETFALFRFGVILARVVGQLQHYGLFPADSAMDRDNLATLLLARRLDEGVL